MVFQIELMMSGNTQLAVGVSTRRRAEIAMMKANLVKANLFFLIA